MTESERREIKAKLAELGLWGYDEAGDPTTDVFDAWTLKERLDAKLAQDVFLTTAILTNFHPVREVVIYSVDQDYQLATGFDYIEAICLAALALPEFLKNHPECAADQNK